MPLFTLNQSNGRYLREGVFFQGGPSVMVVRSKMLQDCPVHSHEFEELGLVMAGSCDYLCGPNTHKIARGDVFVLTEGREHAFLNTKNFTVLNVEYDRQELLSCAGDLKGCPGFHALFTFSPQAGVEAGARARCRLTAPQLHRAVRWVEEIEAELTLKDHGYQTLCRANFFKLITFLSRSYQSIQCESNPLYWQLGSVLAYLENDYAKVITVEELARMANLSLRQFYRVFQEATGQPPLAYLLEVRVRKAIELITSTTLSITEIAFRAGFQDSNYFARQFKKVTGVTPSSYRRAES